MTLPSDELLPDMTEEQRAALELLKIYVGDVALADQQLVVYLAGADWDADLAASRVWAKVAAGTYTMVTVSESGSSRSLSDIHKNAVALAKLYADKAGEGDATPNTDRPRTRNIVRA